MNFFKKLKDSLKKTSENFTKGIGQIFDKSKPNVETLKDLEEFLIKSDVGVKFVNDFSKKIAEKKS